MGTNNQEQKQKKKRNMWIGGIVTGLVIFLTNLNNLIDEYEKLPFAIKLEAKTNTDEIKTNEVETDEAETNEEKIIKATEFDEEHSREEYPKPQEVYTYRIRVITYAAETFDDYQEKIKQAEEFIGELNKVLEDHKYDDFINKEDTKIPESARYYTETDKYYIYVYVNESTGTSKDMAKDVKTLNRKYEEMFTKEKWLGSGNKWSGLIIDYSDNKDMKNKKTVSSEDLLEKEQLLY